MFSSRWPKQKELNDMFVDFWSHVTFLGQFFLTSFLPVYCFPISCFYRFLFGVYVFPVLFLCFYKISVFFFYFFVFIS